MVNQIGLGTRQTEQRIFVLSNQKDLVPGDRYHFDVETDPTTTNGKKYLPFDAITVSNDSDENIFVKINDVANQGMFVPTKAVKAYDRVKIRRVEVLNLSSSGTITTTTVGGTIIGEVVVEFQKEATNVDKVAEAVTNIPVLNMLFGALTSKPPR